MDRLGSLVGLVGLGAIVAGLWLAWPPLALVVGGLVLLAAAAALERPSRRVEADEAATRPSEVY